jgi:saccharopine dehydrogenase (NAD+, L-lysine-forming)
MDGGYQPGLPAALVRYAALQCENLQTANLYTVVQANWKDITYSKGTMEELFRQIIDMSASGKGSKVYAKGNWEKQSWWTYRKFDFGETFETRYCVPMFLEEMRELPTMIPTLGEVGQYMAGFDPVTDCCVFPLGLTTGFICPKLATKPMSKLFQWSLKTFSSPPYGSVIILDAQGMAKELENTAQNVNIRISVFHEDEYVLTAVPAVACLLQILDDSVRKPGLHYQAHIVEPKRFFADMKRMGLDVDVSVQKVVDTK